MLLRHALLAAVLGSASSNPLQHFGRPAFPEKTLTTFRRLEGGDEDNGDEDVDYSWMNGYLIKFIHCFHSETFSDGNVYNEDLVLFRLCPHKRGACSKDCSYGADYVTDLNVFVDAFTEAQMLRQEYLCEMARENCDEDNEECYGEYGAKYEICVQEEGDEEDFNLQEYLECSQYEDGYVGPYCSSDGQDIYLGYFEDDTCTKLAGESEFYDTYGYYLEYSGESIVSDGECASCNEHGGQDQDEEDEDNVLEQCEELYAGSGKCEEEIEDVDEMDTDACEYISELRELAETGESSSASLSKAGKIWLGVLLGLLGLAVILLGYWVFKLRHQEKNKPNLASQAGNLA